MFATDWSSVQLFIREPADIYNVNLLNVYETVRNDADREWGLSKTAKTVYGTQ